MPPEDRDLYVDYALVVLNEDTEEQHRWVSSDYANLVTLRELKRELGWKANIRFTDDGAVWDYLQENVAADVAAYLGIA